jgi:tetratricopeptide (TPR) repeat protein
MKNFAGHFLVLLLFTQLGLFAYQPEDYEGLDILLVPNFTNKYSLCKCNKLLYYKDIQNDAQEALKQAVDPIYYAIEPPRHTNAKYIWRCPFGTYSDKMKKWFDNYFFRDVLTSNFGKINLYSEYAERFNFLYYWFNISCEVRIRTLKQRIEEQICQLEKVKKDGSFSNEYIAYLEKELEITRRQLAEAPALFAQAIQNLSEDFDQIAHQLYVLYNRCLKKHKDAISLYQRGRIAFDRGDTFEFLEDIFSLIDAGNEATPEINLELGKAFNDANLYDHAIKVLSQAIKANPDLKEAYFERATAYFETGNLQLAFSDYLNCGVRPTLINNNKSSHYDFSIGIGLGCTQGGIDSTIEFVPVLFSTIYGLGKGLWALAAEPIKVSKELIDDAINCVEFMRMHAAKELLATLIPELKEYMQNWEQLEEEKKGYYIGYVIGRYGVDALICGNTVRAIQLYKNLKRSNALLTLETAVSSSANTEALCKASEQFFIHRNEYKKKCMLHMGQQEKHIPGANNFKEGKGELLIPIERLKELVAQKLGEGMPVRFSFTEAGYKELIDFDEIIGIHVDLNTKERFPTSIGEIHFDKNGGYHVAPVEPNKIRRLSK